MDVLAYCAASFEQQTRRAAGVNPITCPPVTAETFSVSSLENRDFIYFDLHGFPGASFWMGDGNIVALEAYQLAGANLGGAVVFATNCYLGDDNSPMLDALLQAGAGVVIAGAGRNWSPATGLSYGAGLLGFWIRKLMSLGMRVDRAFDIAKKRVGLSVILNRDATKDTLAFKMFKRAQV